MAFLERKSHVEFVKKKFQPCLTTCKHSPSIARHFLAFHSVLTITQVCLIYPYLTHSLPPDELFNATGGQIVHSESTSLKVRPYKPCCWSDDEMLVEKASTDLMVPLIALLHALLTKIWLILCSRYVLPGIIQLCAAFCNDEQYSHCLNGYPFNERSLW